MTAPVSLCPNRSALVIAPLCVKSHDQRALDATLRDRFRYLLNGLRAARDATAQAKRRIEMISRNIDCLRVSTAKLGGH